MFRKVLFAGMTALGVASPMAMTPAADAHPPMYYHQRVYEVEYRRHHHWHLYGTYYSHYEAERAEHHLRHQGFDVRVEFH